MQLLDDSLYNLWRAGTCEESEVMYKSARPGDLAAKIAKAKAGMMDDDDDDDD